eukprot:16435001-Heterocapsa_arctica.AAC.1
MANGTIPAEGAFAHQDSYSNYSGWISNLFNDGDIEHQPGPGNPNCTRLDTTKWFNALDFPELYWETNFRLPKVPGGLVASCT